MIRAFAAKQGIEITKVYLEAFTGTESDRPKFTEMLLDLLSNGCRTFIVESLDRFARELIVQISLIAELKKKGITMLSAATGEDVTAACEEDPMRNAMVQIQGVFSELDKKLIVRKLRKARDAKRKENGKCEGPKFYGEKEGEMAVLERVRSLRRKPRLGKKLSWEGIAAALNAEGIKTRDGREWTRQNLHLICKRVGIK